MNLNIAICDDEINDISIFKKYISQYNVETNNNIIISSYVSAKELLRDYENNCYDVVLLDIEMPDINGMDLARHLRETNDDLFIVFTTLYPEYMHESFKVQPFQFLTKPIEYKAVYKLFNAIDKKLTRSSKNILIIDTEKEIHFVSLNDILFVSSMKESKSHLRYQLTDTELISKGTLSELESKLATRGFISPSRGFLVNIHQIKTMNSTSLILNKGFKIPISRRRTKELQQLYSHYIIDIL